MSELLSVAEARRRILARIGTAASEWVALEAALDRVLARDLTARRTQPPTAVSAMDGYAVVAAETGPDRPPLRVSGENRAGARAVGLLRPGEAVRIYTGAAVPEGADAIALEENATVEGEQVRFSRPSRPGEFVRPAGLDFQAGWVGLRAGRVLGPRDLGLAASLGHIAIPVRRRPQVAIISTGDEIIRPGEAAGPDAIPSSNAVTLAALVRRWGGVPVDLGIVGDTREALREVLADARQVDCLVTTGGASVGRYDLVRDALGESGLALDFWRLAMRPGKPMMFGSLDTIPVLGLPGNPVSSTVCAMLFLRPVLLQLLGGDPELRPVEARSAAALPANDEREDYLRARSLGHRDGLWWLEAAPRQDSSMFATLAAADALIVRAPAAPAVAPGGAVHALPLGFAEAPTKADAVDTFVEPK